MKRRLFTLCSALSLLLCVRSGLVRAAVPDAPDAAAPAIGQLDGSAGLAVAFTADGRRLLTAGADAARVWDAQTLAPLTPPLRHAGAPLRAAALSADGTRVITAGGTEARVWDAANGRQLFVLPHVAKVWDASFGTDGSKVITASGGDTIDNDFLKIEGGAHVWDAATGKLLHTLGGGRMPAQHAGLSPDGSLAYLVTAFPPRDLRSLNRYRENDQSVWPTERRSRFGVHVYDVGTGRRLYGTRGEAGGDPPRRAHRGIRMMTSKISGRPAFSPDGKLLAACVNFVDPAWVCDARTGRVVASAGEHQPEAWAAFETVAFVPAPAGGPYRLLIAGTALGRSDWCAQLVTLDPHETKPGDLHGTLTRGFVKERNGEWVTSAAVGADVRRVALAGHTPRHDNWKRGEGRRASAVESAGVWDVATGRRLLRVQDGAGDALVALSPAGDRLAVSYPGRANGEGAHTTLWHVPP